MSCWGSNKPVWTTQADGSQASTLTMNPTVPADYIAEQIEADPEANTSEYMAVFRDDLSSLITREVVQGCTDLDNFKDRNIYVVQGTNVINSFPWAHSTCGNFCEGNLAVTNVVSTDWFGTDGSGGSATAGQYTLSGAPTGTTWPGTPQPAGETGNQFYDGTSDGTHNYTVEFDNSNRMANVIATDLNWQNQATLFSIATGNFGVTYDPNNNSLWIATNDGTGVIADYSLAGALLSSFLTGVSSITALAFDPADGTLWFSNGETNLLSQYSTPGALLQSGTPSGLPADNYRAGEFAEGTAVPEPATLLLLDTGLLGLGLMRRYARSSDA